MKKIYKKLLFIFLIVILIFVGIFLYFHFRKPLEKEVLEPEITLLFQENLNAQINSDVTISSFILNPNDLEILNLDNTIDTSVLGEKELKVIYMEKNEKKEQSFIIHIVDTISPTLEFQKEITTTVGKKVDLLKNVKVNDNSFEDIKVQIEGNYDFNQEGEYALSYVASDSSHNEIKEDFVLKVQKEKSYYYEKLATLTGDRELVGTSSNGFEIYMIDGSYYIDDILIANKTYPLKEGFVPTDTYKSANGVTSQCSTCINKTVYQAWLDMKSDASAIGLNIWIQSGYRPYNVQVTLYNKYVDRDGKEAADRYSSRPGHSEHQTGLCFDLNSITDAFANTLEGKWVNENAYKYGFIIRFPKNKESYTGYKYESWHLRYVGTDLAKKLYNDGDWLSLEEYFGITSEYATS